MILHPKTEANFGKFIEQKPHGLLFVGRPGSGKVQLARQFAQEVLKQTNLDNYAYYTELDASQKGIDAVRDLRDFLSKKTTGQAEIRRLALVFNAEMLGTSAQNALLKTLEEPPADTIIVMTVSDTTQLLITILSRVQRLVVLPLELQQVLSNDQLSKHDQNQLIKAFHMSGGAAGLLEAILNDPEHPTVASLLEAKQIVAKPVFERLAMIDELTKTKQDIYLLLESLQRVVDSGFSLAVNGKAASRSKKLHQARCAVADARRQLSGSVNQKLVLTNLFLNL